MDECGQGDDNIDNNCQPSRLVFSLSPHPYSFPFCHTFCLSFLSLQYRFSFEDPEKLTPADEFAVRFHAIRKGGFYLSMDESAPITWPNVEKFVESAIATDFDDFDGFGDITIIPAPVKGFKKRQQPTAEEEKTTQPPPLTDEEVQALRLQKEQERIEKENRRREEMDRKMKEGIFDEDTTDDGDGDGYDGDGEDDDGEGEEEEEEEEEDVLEL